MVKKKIVLYYTKDCPVCKTAREYLKMKKVSFKEIDIDQHPEIDYILASPVICQLNKKGKSRCVIGYNKEKLDKLIKKVKKR